MAWYGDRDIFDRRTNPVWPSRVTNLFTDGLQPGKKNVTSQQYIEGDVIYRYTTASETTIVLPDDSRQVAGAANTMIAHLRYVMEDPTTRGFCIMLVKAWNLPRDFRAYSGNMIENFKSQNFIYAQYYAPVILRCSMTSSRKLVSRAVTETSEGKLYKIKSTNFREDVYGHPANIVNQLYFSSRDTTISANNRLDKFADYLHQKDDYINRSFYPDETIEIWETQYEALTEKYGSKWKEIVNATSFTASEGFLYTPEYYVNACQLTASFPIFYEDQLEEIYKYFAGEDYTPANKDDLTLSETGIPTDWTIYVNGQRAPAITIAMKSEAINNYLYSSENTQAYQKSDFNVDYKYPQFVYPNLNIGKDTQFVEVDEQSGTKGWVYDSTNYSSWDEITDVNYLNKIDLSTVDGVREFEMQAQMRMRIRLSDVIFSSWVYFAIGYIGSPNVPDFELRKKNVASVEGIADGSTIQIIYDQNAPGDDEYKDPDDDFEIDTDPSGMDISNELSVTYKVSKIEMRNLATYLWEASFINDIRLVNNNPIENIVSCKRVPFDVPAGPSRSIVLGNVTAQANGEIVTNIPIIDIGEIQYNGYYGNFLDFAPYTRLILFLPFCGFTEIDPSLLTGKTLSVKYAMDVINAKCRAMLFIDNAYYASYDGNFGIDIPLTGSNRAQVEASLVTAGIGIAATAATAALAPTPKKISSTVKTATIAASAVQTTLETATAAQYHSNRTGNYSSMCAWQETRNCFLIADIPTCQYPSSYAHDKGYPCGLTKTLAQMKGFTVCGDDIDMSGFDCTKEECDMIKNLLLAGVYL